MPSLFRDRHPLKPLSLMGALAASAAVLAIGPSHAPPASGGAGGMGGHGVSPDTVVSFSEDVLPIFEARCAECHGGEDEDGQVITEAYLNLLTYDGVMAGSEFGTVVEAGDPDASILVEMIADGEMPDEGDPVPEEEIEVIRAWIEAGAPDN